MKKENDMSEENVKSDGCAVISDQCVDGVDVVDGVVSVDEGYAVRMVPLVQLRGHPLNRGFEQVGPKWEAFVASIGEHGVMMPLVVRPLGDGYQILAGHRRYTASVAVAGPLWEVSCNTVPCVVRELTESEAVEFLCIENLERENPDPVEEAQLVCAMLGLPEYQGDAEHLADRLKRSVEWVVTRQGLLQLGDEVISALRKPSDDPGHIGVRVAEELLKVPVAERERAVQLVLHPDWGVGALRPREAAAEIRERILEPMRKRAEWEKAAPKLVKAWRKELKGILTKDEFSQLILQAAGWKEIEEGMVARRCATDLFYAYDAGGERTWAALAVRNGMPLWIVPGGDDEVLKSDVVVDEKLLRMAEQAREENGVECWLRTKPIPQAKTGGSDESAVISDQKEEVEDIEDDEWTPKSEAPPEERHVRREAGRTMLVSKDRLERAVELVRLASYDRDLTDDEQLDLPNAVKVNEIGLEAAESVLGYLQWVLDGCPILGADGKN